MSHDITWRHVRSHDITYRFSSSTLAFCSVPPPLPNAMSSSKLTDQDRIDLNTPWSAWCMRSGGQHIVGSKKGCFVQKGCIDTAGDVIWHNMISWNIPEHCKAALTALCTLNQLGPCTHDAPIRPLLRPLPCTAPTRRQYEDLRVQCWIAAKCSPIWCHMMSYDIIWCGLHTWCTLMWHILQGCPAWQLFIRPRMSHCSIQSPAWKQRGKTTIRITPSEQRISSGLSGIANHTWYMISYDITWYHMTWENTTLTYSSAAASSGFNIWRIASWYTARMSWIYDFRLRSASLPFMIGIWPHSREPVW